MDNQNACIMYVLLVRQSFFLIIDNSLHYVRLTRFRGVERRAYGLNVIPTILTTCYRKERVPD